MGFTSVLKRIVRKASSFAKANDGNIAVIVVIAALPMVSVMGMAIDYTRAVNARSEMQQAADAAALMLAQDAANLTPAQLTTRAQSYFGGLYKASNGVSGVSINATYTPNSGQGSTVLITTSANMPTEFMRIAGVTQMPLSTSSTAKWGNTKLRVALALDNTGSMAQAGKMTALQGGAKNLIDTLSATATNQGDVYISIVPFANEVNMGATAYVNSGYIDWSNWSTFNSNLNGYTCGSSNSNRNKTMKCGTANNSTSNWNGCVMDRGNQSAPASTNDDTTSTAPSSGTTLFPADQSTVCPQAVNTLSYDWTTLKQVVTNMSPNGNTNQAIGLQHAWMTLLQQSPYNAPAESANYHYVKAIVLFSDGLNTEDRWYSDAASIDARQETLCTNIKNSGVTIYSIQVNTASDPQSAVLANCASGPSNFYYLTSATQVLSAFQQISTKLSQLRIAQ
jgi:Flp pilus assembly protein TadG